MKKLLNILTTTSKTISNFFKNNKKLVILISVLTLTLTITVSYAWFNGRGFKLNTETEQNLAHLSDLEGKLDITGYSLKDLSDNNYSLNTTIFKTTTELQEEGEAASLARKFIDTDAFLPGALNRASDTLNLTNKTQEEIDEEIEAAENAIIEANTQTRIIKVTNHADMDVMVKTQFLIDDKYDYDLTSFWYLITDVTSDVLACTEMTTSDTTLSSNEKVILNYLYTNPSSRTLNNYNENNIDTRVFDGLTKRIELGQIDEPTDYEAGNTKYFRLDYGLSEQALRSSGSAYFNRYIEMNVFIYYGQVGAPDEDEEAYHNSLVEVSTEDELKQVLKNVNLAYYGDTIKLLNDITLTPDGTDTSIDVNRPLNFDLNGYTLTVEGDFNISYTATNNITLDLSKSSQLIVYGDITLTAPNATINVIGDNEKAAGASAADIIMYGEHTPGSIGLSRKIYNNVGQTGNGLNLTDLYIVNYYCDSDSTLKYLVDNSYIVMGAESKLIVNEGIEIDEVSAGEITDVEIENYGTIGWVHLESMVLPNVLQIQIDIYNNGLIGRETVNKSDKNNPLTHTTNAITLPVSSTTANTRIVKGMYSNNFSISGSNNFNSSNVTLEETSTIWVTEIANEVNAYRLYLDLTIPDSNNKVQYVLEDYFKDNPDSIKGIEKLVIECTTDTFINTNDFTYMKGTTKGDTMRDLSYLDLSLANTEYTATSAGGVKTTYQYAIALSAMEGKTGLTTLILPNNIERIGANAFKDTGLSSITIPPTLEYAGSKAFNTVTEVVINSYYPIPDNSNFLSAFGSTNVYYLVYESVVDTFKAQFALRSQQIANHVYCHSTLFETRYIRMLDDGTIEIVAYTSDINESGAIPNTIEYEGNFIQVTSIGRDAYINMSNNSGILTSITIGNGITNIGKNAFENLTSFDEVLIESALTIGDYAFNNCQLLKKVTINSAVEIGVSAFAKCTKLNELTMTKAKTIKDDAFNGCSSIKELTIPSVTYIGDNAFKGCVSFEKVVFGSIYKLSDGSFEGCVNLEELGLTTVTKVIGKNAFKDCIELSTIYTYDEQGSVKNTGYAYFSDVEEIMDEAFSGCVAINYIIGDELLTIGDSAFYNLNQLKYIDLPKIKTIGSSAFVGCTNLSLINIESVEKIGDLTFKGCSLIEYAFLPNATEIGEEAFSGCSSIKAMSLGSPTIDTNAFKGVNPFYIDLSTYELNDTIMAQDLTLGNGTGWQTFPSYTKYYFEEGSSDADTENRRAFVTAMVNRASVNKIGYSYPKDTLIGEYVLYSDDYYSNITFGTRQVGLIKNLYLYDAKLDTTNHTLEILSYHGPKLTGNMIFPYTNYQDASQTDQTANRDMCVDKTTFDKVIDNTLEDTYGKFTINGVEYTTTKIGDYAYFATDISVNSGEFVYSSFANSITEIGIGAFESSNIEFLYMNKVITIDESAFRTCPELRYVDLGLVKTVKDYAFTEADDIGTDLNLDNYFGGNVTYDFTVTKLTKVICRHLSKVGKGAFMKRVSNQSNGAISRLFIVDITINQPDVTVGGKIVYDTYGVPEYDKYWLGISSDGTCNVGGIESDSYDTYLLCPYNSNTQTFATIQGEYSKAFFNSNLLYDYGYYYQPDYKINDVEVGMFLLKPASNINDGFFVVRSFTRNVGVYECEQTGLTESDIGTSLAGGTEGVTIMGVKANGTVDEIKYTIPSSGLGQNIGDFDGTRLTTGQKYQFSLLADCYRNITTAGCYFDLAFGPDYTSIPTLGWPDGFAMNAVYSSNLTEIKYLGELNCETIYCEHLDVLYVSCCDTDGYINIIDTRSNTDENGNRKIVTFEDARLQTLQYIYVNEEDYDTYVEQTKSIIIEPKGYNLASTDIELYTKLLAPGTYIGTLNLLKSDSYNLEALIVPLAKEPVYEYDENEVLVSTTTEEIIWQIYDENDNDDGKSGVKSSLISCDDGIITVNKDEGVYYNEGTAYVYCKLKVTTTYESGQESDSYTNLLAKFKVTILKEDETTVEYYNISRASTRLSGSLVYGIKVNRMNATLNVSVKEFNPSVEITSFLNNIIDEVEFNKYNNLKFIDIKSDTNRYEIVSVGVMSYRGMTIKSDAVVYLISDEYLTEIYDYGFFEVAFTEVWLRNVTKIMDKAFLNGSIHNELIKVVLPNIKYIGKEAFSSNHNIQTVVVGDEDTSSLTYLYDYAFYAMNKLTRFGIVKEDLSYETLTNTQIVTGENNDGGYTLTFLREEEEVFDEINNTYSIEKHYYNNNTDPSDDYRYQSFVYLPDTITYYGTNIFYQASLIEEVRLPSNYKLDYIPEYAFAYCKNLYNVVTTSTITDVDGYAFYQCESLPDYTTEDVKDANDEVIDTIKVGGFDFTYIENIGESAFRQCYLFNEIHFGSIKSIDDYAFYGCTRLRFMYFDECKPKSDVEFGENWNGRNHELSRYYVSATYQEYFEGIDNTYVKEAVGYKQDDDDQEHEYVVNYIYDDYGHTMGVKLVCYNAIVDPTITDDNILEQIPDYLVVDGQIQPVLEIGKYAYKGFEPNTACEDMILPKYVYSVEDYAFSDCQFKTYTEAFDSSSIKVVTYGDYVFADNILLTTCTMTRMESGGSSVFDACALFTSLILSNNVNEYGVYTAPVIEDDFFTGARVDAKCTIKTGTLSLFTQKGYVGRIYEDGDDTITLSDGSQYVLKLIEGNYQIIRYIPVNSTITGDYTVPTQLTGTDGVTRNVIRIGSSAYASLTVSGVYTLTIPHEIIEIGDYAFYKTGFNKIIIGDENGTTGSTGTIYDKYCNIEIGSYAFSENNSLTEVDMEYIYDFTFENEGIFSKCTYLNSVTLSDTMTNIPGRTFEECSNIGEFDIMNVNKVGDYAFYGLTSLVSFYSSTINQYGKTVHEMHLANIANIGEYAFAKNEQIQKVHLNNVIEIEQYAFSECINLTITDYFNSSQSVGEGAFYGCVKIDNLAMNIKNIPDKCFYGCIKLNTVLFNYTTAIGDYAFYGCTSLESISLNKTNEIGEYSFSECSKLSTVDLGMVSSIGAFAFQNDKLITSIDLINVTDIGRFAFNNCDITGSLELKSVEYIYDCAFMNNIHLTSVTFKNLYYIRNRVFYNCVLLKTIYFNENKTIDSNNTKVLGCPTGYDPDTDKILDIDYTYLKNNSDSTYIGYANQTSEYTTKGTVYHYFNNSFENINDDYIIYVPISTNDEILEDYKEYFSYFESHIFELGTMSTENPLYMVKDLGDNNVKIIRYFGDSLNTSYTVPATLDSKTVTEIGDYAYYLLKDSVEYLDSINTSNVTEIGDYAFYGLNAKTLALTDVEYIGKYAFSNNQEVIYLTLPKAIKIDDYAFYGCTNLAIVRTYPCLTYLGEECFNNCLSLRNVYLTNITNNLVLKEEELTFGENTMEELTIRVPSSVLSNYQTLFSYYSSLVKTGEISDADFSYRITNDGVSDGIEIISYEGQERTATIPETINGINVIKILDNAFENSLNLEVIYLPGNLTSISSHAFLGANNLRAVYVNNQSSGNTLFISIDGRLFYKGDGTNITTFIYYPILMTGTSYSFNESSSYDLTYLTNIYENAFYQNNFLEELTIPATVKYIGECAFSELSKLTTVTFLSPATGTPTVPTLFGTNIFSATLESTFKIYVPDSIYNNYISDKLFGYYKQYIYKISTK